MIRAMVCFLALGMVAGCRSTAQNQPPREPEPVETTTHVEEVWETSLPPSSPHPSPEYALSVDQTFRALEGFSASAKRQALEDAQFEALRALANQVAGHIEGPMPDRRGDLVNGAVYVRAQPAGTDAITVTVRIVLRDALVSYKHSVSAEYRNAELKRRIEQKKSVYGDLVLHASGTGACVEPDRGPRVPAGSVR